MITFTKMTIAFFNKQKCHGKKFIDDAITLDFRNRILVFFKTNHRFPPDLWGKIGAGNT
jgi:hypothetical protein